MLVDGYLNAAAYVGPDGRATTTLPACYPSSTSSRSSTIAVARTASALKPTTRTTSTNRSRMRAAVTPAVSTAASDRQPDGCRLPSGTAAGRCAVMAADPNHDAGALCPGVVRVAGDLGSPEQGSRRLAS